MDLRFLLPRESQLQRETPNPPSCLLPTRSDAGYGSAFEPPEKLFRNPLSRASIYGLLPLLDGNRSSERIQSSENEDDSNVFLRLDADGLPREPVTLSRSTSSSRPTLPKSFSPGSGTKHSRRHKSDAGLISLRKNPLRLPDRFVPFRDHATLTTDIFRTSKPVDQLTPPEKLLRNGDATPDAFDSGRSRANQIAFNFRVLSRSDPGVRSGGSILSPISRNVIGFTERQVSAGAVWAVGGVAPSETAANSGRDQLVQRGMNARLFSASLPPRHKGKADSEKHEARLASALQLDRVQRVLEFSPPSNSSSRSCRKPRASLARLKTFWDGTQWVNPVSHRPSVLKTRRISATPFRVLDAPDLRDDFYCSLLAYSPNSHILAVGLGNKVHGWSLERGGALLDAGGNDNAWLTSIAFSSTQGCKCILAIGRSNCKLTFLSIYDSNRPAPQDGVVPRIEIRQPAPISSLSWKPTCTVRTSRNPFNSDPSLVKTEELLAGDNTGRVWYYYVEWPESWECERDNWRGEVVLLAVIRLHTQQICGLAWSPTGHQFVTGANDNLCCLVDASKIMDRWDQALRDLSLTAEVTEDGNRSEAGSSRTPMTLPRAVELRPGDETHLWPHEAAVKAIAFCPWQEGLVATGGGFGDKSIHFFHATSGTLLATIAVAAQVTSLIWSTTRREIVATLGYAEPEHKYRIAVFSWPECQLVAAVQWEQGHRALHAIAYPNEPKGLCGIPNSGKVRSQNQATTNGCIVILASDNTVNFHEVWSSNQKSTVGGTSMLGGSDILEALEGIDKEGDVIR